MEEKICTFVKREELVERAKQLIRGYCEDTQKIKARLKRLESKESFTKEEETAYKVLEFRYINIRNEFGAAVEVLAVMGIMEVKEAAEYLDSLNLNWCRILGDKHHE